MRIGAMRHRVEIQSFTENQADDGEITNDWVTDATVWAEVVALSGRELYNAQQIQADTSHKVTMRYREIDSSQRLIFANWRLEIVSVIPDPQKAFVTLNCVSKPITIINQLSAGGATIGGGIG